MTTFPDCPKCKKPIMPNASAWLQAHGPICRCGTGMPLGRTVRPVDETYRENRVSVQVEAENPVGSQTVTLPYPPTANHFKVPVVMEDRRIRHVLSAEARQYKQYVAYKVSEAHLCCVQGPVRLTLHVYRPRKIGDLDNALKLSVDALKGYAFEDDEQVEEIHAYRHEDKKNARVDITIEGLERGKG